MPCLINRKSLILNHKSPAFTLIELLIVISIIGILAAFAFVSFSSAQARARDAERKNNLKQLERALQMYYNDNQAYPIVAGWTNLSSVTGLTPIYIKKLPTDPRYGQTYTASQPTCGAQYLYYSNGTDYKLLAHCSPEGNYSSSDGFYDPVRPTWAWQVSSDGGNW